MGLRELLILVLILAIVGVIVRGLYVALKTRRGQLRMALDKNIPQYDPDELSLSELPNGGARSVERSFAHVVMQNSRFSSRDKLSQGEQAIPVLMDSVDSDRDDVVSPTRSSSVSNARQAVRQKHGIQGNKVAQPPKPTQRPIDVMAARSAAEVSTSDSTPLANTQEFTPPPPAIGDADDRVYVDPLDSHIFKDEDYNDDDYNDDDYKDDTVAYRLPDSESSQPDNDLIPYDEREELSDGDAAALSGDDDPDDDYMADDEYDDDPLDDDDDDEEDESDDRDDRIADDDSDQEFDDEEYEDDFEDDFEDDLEDDFEEELPLNPTDHEVDDGELEAEEFESVYGAEQYDEDTAFDEDDYDDEIDNLDDYSGSRSEQKTGPARWLQWAGDKISGMTSAAVSRGEREREALKSERSTERAEPTIGGTAFDDEIIEEPVPTPAPAAPITRSKPEPLHKSRQSELAFDDEDASHDLYDDENGDRYEEQVPPPRRTPDSPRVRAPKRESRRAETKAVEPAEAPVPMEYSEVLVLNVVAKPDREFTGVDLLPVLLTCGLRFGDMSIFHRHLDNTGRSPVVFSMANIVNPGTFDLNQINDFSTRGVCFFMTLPNVVNSMQAFDLMLDVAQQVRIALDGDLKDDNRSVMTAQTIEHYRQRVRDFDLRQLRQQK